MNKLLRVSALLFFLTSLASSEVSIKLAGGMTFLFANDYNRGIQGLYDFYLDNYDGVTGQYKPLNLGLNIEGELGFSIGRNIAVGIGAGYFQFSRESEFGYQLPYVSSRDSLSPDIQLIPLTVNVHYYVSRGPRLRTDWFVGAGYYLLTFNHAWSVKTDFFSYQSEQTFRSSQASLGFQGGVGIEFEISPRFALLFQASGRLIKFSDLKGTLNEKISLLNVSWEDESGDAYFWFYGHTVNNRAYAQVSFAKTKPSENEYSAVRHGILNLSGMTAGIGLKFQF